MNSFTTVITNDNGSRPVLMVWNKLVSKYKPKLLSHCTFKHFDDAMDRAFKHSEHWGLECMPLEKCPYPYS